MEQGHHTRYRRALIILYGLLTYVILQFAWWTYHIVELSEAAGRGDKATGMVVGEGLVFLIILMTGAWMVHRAIRKESRLLTSQNNFLLSVTHELKSPLSSIKLGLQTLLNKQVTEEQKKLVLQTGINETDRLVAQLDNILLATRIHATGHHPVLEVVNLSTLCEDICKTIPAAERIERIIEPNIEVNGDRNSIRSVVINLVENALKYSDSKVMVLIKKNSDNVEINVTDQGIGVNPDESEKIFDLFYRSGNENVRRTKGTGLGLYITRALLKSMNGEIILKPNKPKGSNFVVTIPTRK